MLQRWRLRTSPFEGELRGMLPLDSIRPYLKDETVCTGC
jgi:hypothetical protein